MHEMEVDFYSVSHGYGFCTGKGVPRTFFRVEDFLRFDPSEPLPLAGEPVIVDRLIDAGPSKSPRANTVQRVDAPVRLVGQVKSFDADKGWGFIDHEGEAYFLHRSDLVEPFLPVKGTDIAFYVGQRKGKPRACYVSRPAGVR